MPVLILVLVAVAVVISLAATMIVVRRRSGRSPAPPREQPSAGAGGKTPVTTAGSPVTTAGSPVTTAGSEAELGPHPPPLPPAADEGREPPRLRDRLGAARKMFATYASSVLARSSISSETWQELEEALVRADVGLKTSRRLLADLRDQVTAGTVTSPAELMAALEDRLSDTLRKLAGSTALTLKPGVTNVWLFVGVNGVGKTTTIGKVAASEVASGHQVVMAAGDTFRAAAIDQLELWATRAGADFVRGAPGGDSSAVIFDAIQHAAARGSRLVLADTAGRLHTKSNLMEELKKVRRVAERPPGQVTEVLLVVDATTGQNGLAQAREFTEAIGVTGVVLTKLDGTAKGGIVVAIQEELGIPVKLVGLGEGRADLVAFDPEAFVAAMLH